MPTPPAGAPVTKQQIVDKFNSLVRDQLNPPAGNAPWYAGNVTGTYGAQMSNHQDLGQRSEDPKSAGDIPGTGLMASTIFNVLHGFAMELTRVRKARFIYIISSTPPVVYTSPVTVVTALKPRFALYFPIPGNQREPGTPVNSGELDSFLVALRNEINLRRTDDNYAHTFSTGVCHTSCHSSCHGSRGRR
jgi:hypothetical protein